MKSVVKNATMLSNGRTFDILVFNIPFIHFQTEFKNKQSLAVKSKTRLTRNFVHTLAALHFNGIFYTIGFKYVDERNNYVNIIPIIK